MSNGNKILAQVIQLVIKFNIACNIDFTYCSVADWGVNNKIRKLAITFRNAAVIYNKRWLYRMINPPI